MEVSSIEEIFHHLHANLSPFKRQTKGLFPLLSWPALVTAPVGCSVHWMCIFFIQFLIFLGLTLYFNFNFSFLFFFFSSDLTYLVISKYYPPFSLYLPTNPCLYTIFTSPPPSYPPTRSPACSSTHPQTYPQTYLPTHSPIHFPTYLSLIILRKI